MKKAIIIDAEDDSEEDCRRTTYSVTDPDTGKRIVLSACALDSSEAIRKAEAMFGKADLIQVRF